jgi:2-phosphoglycerate kinase
VKRRELSVTRGDAQYAFSTGVVVESLQGAGVPTDEAIRTARAVEKHYRSGGERAIPLERLVGRIAKELEEKQGKEVADRFRVQTPPFVPVSVQRGGDLEPFSRRVLAKSLEKLGLRFKEAYAVASQVEQSLRSKGYEVVSDRELSHLTALALEVRSGRDARIRFEAQLGAPPEVQVVEPDGLRFPFSRGILAQSLMAVGLGPDLSYTLAKHLENILLHKGETDIPRDDLHREMRALLLEEAGEDFARRYDLMRSVRRPERPIIVLVGGAPGVGKSSLAAELAYRLGIRRVVSSDAVREALRSLISPELSPSLHRSSYTAWRSELLPEEQASAKPKRKRVIRGFQAQAQQLATALLAIVERGIYEGISMVVEGIHLVPGLLPVAERRGATIVELVLVVEDKDRHRAHFEARGRDPASARGSQTYLEHFGEIRIIHDFIAERAKQEGVPRLEGSNTDEAIDRALERILEATLAEASGPRRAK